jgi:hypothetical protein
MQILLSPSFQVEGENALQYYNEPVFYVHPKKRVFVKDDGAVKNDQAQLKTKNRRARRFFVSREITSCC